MVRDAARRTDRSPGEFSSEIVLERLLYPVINECARLLDEGIAIRASDIDVAMLTGFGWPVHTGGPLFWADTLGVRNVRDVLQTLSATHGDSFRPADRIEKLAASNGQFEE